MRQTAEVENSMNGIERILYYANHVEQEAPYDIPDHDPPREWPTTGDVVAENMVVAYRPGLPPVLKGVSMHVQSGEHIGIVGRFLGPRIRGFLSSTFRLCTRRA